VTVVRVRPLGYDDNGDPIEGEASRLTIDGCAVAPRSSSDITDRGRQGVIVGLSLFAPYGADITHGDRVEVDGVPYEVDGEAGSWKNPFTEWEAGVEVALRRAAG
jgi:hypothetical protein